MLLIAPWQKQPCIYITFVLAGVLDLYNGLSLVPKTAIYESMPRQNGGQFPDNIFKCIFLSENI